jgi:hypothetical protein
MVFCTGDKKLTGRITPRFNPNQQSLLLACLGITPPPAAQASMADCSEPERSCLPEKPGKPPTMDIARGGCIAFQAASETCRLHEKTITGSPINR